MDYDAVSMVNHLESVSLTIVLTVNRPKDTFRYINKYIEQCEFYRIKLIIVLDSCEHDFKTFVHLAKCENVTLIKGYFGNPGQARNAGLSVAKTKWIMFCDSDDVVYLKNVTHLLAGCSSKYDVIIGSFDSINLYNSNYSQYIAESIENVMLNPGIWRWVFKNEFISELKFPALSMGEDQLFLAQVVNKMPNIHISKKLFYTYHIGDVHQLTSKKQHISNLKEAILILDTYQINHKDKLIIRLNLAISALRRGNLLTKIFGLKIFIACFRNNFFDFKSKKVIIQVVLSKYGKKA